MATYWLVKSEPSDYSLDDLARDGRTAWSGVRNYQARNFMRDQMQVGDLVFFYHSSTATPALVGLARVASQPYPDPTAFDKKSPYYDPSSRPEHPVWMLVDLEFVERFPRPITLSSVKAEPLLEGIMLARKGCRLSVQPVAPQHARLLLSLAGSKQAD